MSTTRFILLFALTLGTLLSWQYTFFLYQNTLENNGQWLASKFLIEKGLMGSTEFFQGTQSLHQNKLHLDSWHGYQEVVTQEEKVFDELTFDAVLSDNSYLYFLFDIQENYSYALRISKHPQLPSSCVKISKTGEFLKTYNLKNLPIEKKIRLKVAFNSEENHITLNNSPPFSCPFLHTQVGRIGFRGSLNAVSIDNIILKEKGEVVWKEFFNYSPSFAKKRFIINFFITLVIAIFTLLFFKNTFNLIITLLFSVLFTSLVTFWYLNVYFVGNYPNISSFFNTLKKEEAEILDSGLKQHSEDIMKNYYKNDSFKIMIVGSSQTWGAGASKEEFTFPALLKKKLELENTNYDIEVINTGFSGMTSYELLEEYENHWVNLQPNITIINLSSNDYTYQIAQIEFIKNLERFISINKNHNIKTVLLLEANSQEKNAENPYHQAMNELCEAHQIICLDIHTYLNEQNTKGIIWWDFVHLTDFGHHLVSEYLASQLLKFQILPDTFEKN